MMKCMHQWAANHGLLYTPPLPMQIEPAHPPDMVEFGCPTCQGDRVVSCRCEGGDLCGCPNEGEKPCPDCD